MAEHRVCVSQTPSYELVNTDLVVEIDDEHGKLGELRLSRGGVDWWPRDARNGVTMTWEQFRDRLEGYRL
ncbi:MAG TPA: hypothetical protein VMD91_03830 [Candidatus Sulfotelmatobacter sp.]|nr:hypothetical protein [Candidatus Sulfotelmatobacter sp.]